MTPAFECLTEILMSKKSSSSRMRASSSALSTSAAAVGAPCLASRSFSSDPAFTPMRIGTLRALASRAISRTLSWYLMLPGLMRSPWPPAPSAASAYFHWKWGSATTGTVDLAAIAVRASASSQCGTATRTMSTPAATSEAICCRVALMSAVLVVVIDWMRIGASPPIVTSPTRTCRVFLRSVSTVPVSHSLRGVPLAHPRSLLEPPAPPSLRGVPLAHPRLSLDPPAPGLALLAEHVEDDLPVLGFVHLEQDQPLPPPQHRRAVRHGDRVRGGREQHRLHVRRAVPALVGLVQVLRAARRVVVRVVHVVGDQVQHPGPEVLERAVLPLVDDQRARRVGAERNHRSIGDTRVLDRPFELLREVEERVALRSGDLDGRGCGCHPFLLVSFEGTALERSPPGSPDVEATGSSNVKALPRPGSLSAQIRPPCASTTERAMASPMPVPPSSRERDSSTR